MKTTTDCRTVIHNSPKPVILQTRPLFRRPSRKCRRWRCRCNYFCARRKCQLTPCLSRFFLIVCDAARPRQQRHLCRALGESHLHQQENVVLTCHHPFGVSPLGSERPYADGMEDRSNVCGDPSTATTHGPARRLQKPFSAHPLQDRPADGDT